MIDFDYRVRTKLYFGRGKEKQVGEILASYNASKVLIIIGQGSVKKNGLLDVVIDSLDKNNIQHKLLEGVRPNPTIDFVIDGLKVAKEFQPDFILAVGGGSVIDTMMVIRLISTIIKPNQQKHYRLELS